MEAGFNLKAWRTQLLGEVKETDGYKSLTRNQRVVVDYIVRRRMHPENGAFESQSNLAEHFGVCRKTMNRWMLAIEAAGVLVSEKRYGGKEGGRMSNVYRVPNPNAMVETVPQSDKANVPQPTQGLGTNSNSQVSLKTVPAEAFTGIYEVPQSMTGEQLEPYRNASSEDVACRHIPTSAELANATPTETFGVASLADLPIDDLIALVSDPRREEVAAVTTAAFTPVDEETINETRAVI